MAAITTTGTLTAGNSRTFTLAPGSALTLTLLPNCRVTVTETPETVSASDAGGNSPRTHFLQYGGVFTYGPYAMGGSVVVANASKPRLASIFAEPASHGLGITKAPLRSCRALKAWARRVCASIGRLLKRRTNPLQGKPSCSAAGSLYSSGSGGKPGRRSINLAWKRCASFAASTLSAVCRKM